MPDFGALRDRLGEILPFLMIFVLWIVFSLLGSRMRNRDTSDQQPAEASQSLQEKFLEMIAPGAAGDDSQQQRKTSDFERLQARSSGSITTVKGAPPVTAKPITPKWWGA